MLALRLPRQDRNLTQSWQARPEQTVVRWNRRSTPAPLVVLRHLAPVRPADCDGRRVDQTEEGETARWIRHRACPLSKNRLVSNGLGPERSTRRPQR
jgi:hypothetical protein